MRVIVRFMNVFGVLALVGWVSLLRQLDWIWGRPPSGWMFGLMMLPVVAGAVAVGTSFARRKGPAVLLGGVFITAALLFFGVVAVARDGGVFCLLPLPYIVTWWGMYYGLPSGTRGK